MNPAKALDHLTANRSHAAAVDSRERLRELWHAAIGLDAANSTTGRGLAAARNRLLPVASQTLWDEHAILAVPAAVFGTDDANRSVITCLFDMKAHDLATPPP